MKILVVSDTHGKTDGVIQFIKAHHQEIDAIWHLGDHYKDAVKIAHKTGIPLHGVKGNCDLSAQAPEDLIVEAAGYRILLTHGHVYGVKHSMLRLFLKAQEDKLDMVCFGHTHVAIQTQENGIVLFNPGSASEPRLGSYPSVGMVTLSPHGINASIVPLASLTNSRH